MKVTAVIPVEQVVDVLCDVCGESTRYEDGSLEYGTVKGSWGYNSKHDNERYEVHLCETCFFGTLAYLRQEHRQNNMFADNYQPASEETFGREV